MSNSQTSYVKEHFTDARKFIDYLRPSNEAWVNPQGINDYVYRGTWNSSWELLPSAWRENTPELLRNVGRYLRKHQDIASERFLRGEPFAGLQSLYGGRNLPDCLPHILHYAAELECIWRFAALADELGFHVPERSRTLTGIGFLKGATLDSHRHPQIGAAALAQHHGIPTRLLDWTFDPLTAAYFAVRPEGRTEESKELAVWALNKREVENQTPVSGLWVVTFEIPRHYASFLHAQSGLFTYIENADKYFLDNCQWPLLDDVIQPSPQAAASQWERALVKCTLNITDIRTADKLRDILWQERISTSRLMPSFDNVVKDVVTWAKAYPERPMNEKQL